MLHTIISTGFFAMLASDISLAATVEQNVRQILSQHDGLPVEPEVRVIDGVRVRVPPDRVIFPGELQELYKKSPQVVIDVLLRIADGARPAHSATAAGLAVCLIDSPQAAVVVAKFFDLKTYDAVNPHWKHTTREHWILMIRAKQAGR